jgi:hypothetical protein
VDRLLEPRPALIPVEPGGLVVGAVRAGAYPDHQTAAGQEVDRGERLRERDRTTDDGEGDRRRDRHLARRSEHRRERGRAVQPRSAELEVVVHRDGRDAEALGGPDVLDQPREVVPRLVPGEQREVHAELHPRPPDAAARTRIVSVRGRGSGRDAMARRRWVVRPLLSMAPRLRIDL